MTPKVSLPVIISLTSYPARIPTIHKTIESLLNQTVKADKVILWLTPEEFPNKEKDLPKELLNLTSKGLTIDWYHNIKSYTKLIPALKKYPNSLIITVDDDAIYQDTIVEKLLRAYIKKPYMIHTLRAHGITFNGNEVAPYKKWTLEMKSSNPSYNNFFTGVGGVLYPPHTLHSDVMNEEKFMKLAPKADDIWFWAMAVHNGTKINLIQNVGNSYILIPETQTSDALWISNMNGGGNDKQLVSVLKAYPDVFNKLEKPQIEVKPFSVKKEIPPKVSVIIPVHNDAPYLVQCLNSVVNQTLEDIEIICVNDGSTDNSLNILNEYASKDNRFKIINQENSGAAVARNKGIEIATGDYLSILDADDFFEDNMLEYLYYTSKAEKSDVVICGYYFYDNRTREDVQIEYPHIPETLVSPFKTEEVKDNLFDISLETAWTKLWKTDLIKKNEVSFDNVPCCNDVAFTCLALACSDKISFTNVPFVHYRFFNKNRLTNNLDRPYFMQKTFATLYKNLVEKKVYDKYKNSYISFIKARMRGGFGKWMGENSKKALFAIPQTLPSPIVQELFTPKDRPAVSLIVAVYNMEKYLPQCMDSLINQTLKNIEIICVDDGSTDSCLKILQDYSSKDNRIKVLTQPNSRQSIARRNAMKIAAGEYVQCVDADDYLDLDTCECLYLYSKLYDLDMCFFTGKNFMDGYDRYCNDAPMQLKWLPENFPPVFSYKNLLNVLAILNVGAAMTFYRHDFLKEHHIQWIEEKIAYEDTPFFIESLFSAEKIGALREDFYHRRKHATATTENLITNFPDYCTVVLKAIGIAKRLADETAFTNYFHGISKNTLNVYNLACNDEAKRKFKKVVYDFFKEGEKISGIHHKKDIRQWCKTYEKRLNNV